MTGTCWQVVPAPPLRREEARLPEDLEEGADKGWALHTMKRVSLRAIARGFPLSEGDVGEGLGAAGSPLGSPNCQARLHKESSFCAR